MRRQDESLDSLAQRIKILGDHLAALGDVVTNEEPMSRKSLSIKVTQSVRRRLGLK